MAKKKESKTTKAKGPAKKAASGRTPRVAAHGPEAEAAATQEPNAPAERSARTPRAPRERDPRLPPPGTVLQKRDRHGNVRCECTVEEDGIRYAGKPYRSLSGAAMAAAKDLGLTNKTQNGWVFWGVTKPPRPAGDPLAALEHAWERYRERAGTAVDGATGETRDRVREAIERHADVIAALRKKVAVQ